MQDQHLPDHHRLVMTVRHDQTAEIDASGHGCTTIIAAIPEYGVSSGPAEFVGQLAHKPSALIVYGQFNVCLPEQGEAKSSMAARWIWAGAGKETMCVANLIIAHGIGGRCQHGELITEDNS